MHRHDRKKQTNKQKTIEFQAKHKQSNAKMKKRRTIISHCQKQDKDQQTFENADLGKENATFVCRFQ